MLRHIGDVIGDPETFVNHMIKDAMRSPKDDLPPLISKEEDNYNYAREIIHQEKCRVQIIQVGRDGDQQTQVNSSEMKSDSCMTPSKKRHKHQTESVASLSTDSKDEERQQ